MTGRPSISAYYIVWTRVLTLAEAEKPLKCSKVVAPQKRVIESLLALPRPLEDRWKSDGELTLYANTQSALPDMIAPMFKISAKRDTSGSQFRCASTLSSWSRLSRSQKRMSIEIRAIISEFEPLKYLLDRRISVMALSSTHVTLAG